MHPFKKGSLKTDYEKEHKIYISRKNMTGMLINDGRQSQAPIYHIYQVFSKSPR